MRPTHLSLNREKEDGKNSLQGEKTEKKKKNNRTKKNFLGVLYKMLVLLLLASIGVLLYLQCATLKQINIQIENQRKEETKTTTNPQTSTGKLQSTSIVTATKTRTVSP